MIEYFKADPIACLAEVNEIGDYAFDELFFKVIGGNEDMWFNLQHFNSTGSSFRTYIVFRYICEKISKIAFSYLFTPYKSETEMIEGFKIIEILIKFMKRYISLLYHFSLEPSDDILFKLNSKNILGKIA